MAAHSSIFAQKILWTEELGGLQSMGSQRIRHSLETKQQQELRYDCSHESLLMILLEEELQSK